MVSQENINVIRRLYDVYNKNNVDELHLMDSCFSPHVKFHDPAMPSIKAGLETVKQAELKYIQAFPKKKTQLDSLLPVDDKIIVRWTVTGTQKGRFQDLLPTFNPIHVSGISIYTLANGKITEVWQMWDRFGLFNQLKNKELLSKKAA